MNTKKQITLYLVGSAILLLVLILLFIYPVCKKVKENSAELIEIKKEVVIIDNKKGEIKNTRGACVLNESDFQKAQDVLVSLDVPVKLIEFLEDTANDSSLYINISPVSLKKVYDDLWDFVSFRLNLFGSYSNFMKFFEKLESSPFLIEIQDLSIKRMTASETDELVGVLPNDVRANLNLRVFAK